MNWKIWKSLKNLRRNTKTETFVVTKFVCKSCGKVFQANLPYKRAKDISDVSCVCDECLFHRRSYSCIDVEFQVIEEKLA